MASLKIDQPLSANDNVIHVNFGAKNVAVETQAAA
jgi:hypothetical protein